jgi:hypothetical protein
VSNGFTSADEAREGFGGLVLLAWLAAQVNPLRSHTPSRWEGSHISRSGVRARDTRRTLEAGDLEGRLDLDHGLAHPRATPAMALLDWLYLARSPHSRPSPPLPRDVESDELDKARLRRLAKAMGLEESLTRDGKLVLRARPAKQERAKAGAHRKA